MAATILQKPRYNGSISYAKNKELMYPNIERGVVLIIGKSPKSKVTILSFDSGSRRGEQVDVMQNVTVTEEKGKLRLNGESLRVSQEFKGTIPTVVEIVLTLNDKCRECGNR